MTGFSVRLPVMARWKSGEFEEALILQMEEKVISSQASRGNKIEEGVETSRWAQQ